VLSGLYPVAGTSVSPMGNATPSPSPTPIQLPFTGTEMSHPLPGTRNVTTWLDEHGLLWLGPVLQIALILVLTLVVRAVALRLISRVVDRMASETGTSGMPRSRWQQQLLLTGERRRQRAKTVGSVLCSIASVTIWGIACITVLGQLGIQLAPILASAGIVGIAVGFGARNVVMDFLSGMFMILEDQFGVGDVIDTGSATGTVEHVGLRITRLRDADGVVWYIRNGEVKRIGNRSQGWGNAVVELPVAPSENLSRVRELIEQTAEALSKDENWDEKIWGSPQIAGVESFDSEAVVLRVQIKTIPQQDLEVARELRARLKVTFDHEGVALAKVDPKP
jgi:moderate conductance mechanosensitive channel